MKRHPLAVVFRIALAISAITLAFAACKKSPETIGNGLISDNDYITPYHTDTLTVVCHSFIDSISTKNVTNGLLGSMSDPVFGGSQAGFCTQFRFSTTGQNFGSNPVVDSVVLQLYLTGYYGDTTTWQTVHAYMLTDTLSAEGSYYNYTEVALDNMDYANGYQFQPHPRKKTNIIGTDTIGQPILRIPLDNSLGEFLIGLDSTVYKDPILFKEQFHGLCLKCDPAVDNGSVSYINLTNNSFTYLQLYYHNAATPEKAMRYSYYVTSADTYFNQISHDYNAGDADFVKQVVEGDTAMGQQRLYLQTMGGVRTKIKFPTIAHWTDTLDEGSYIVINEAKLIVPAATVDTAIFTAPSTLVVVSFKADGTTAILPDYYEGSNYFGGNYNYSTNRAEFRISEYMQDLVSGTATDYGLSLGINGGAYKAERLVINGPETTENNLRVELTYSIVKE